MQQYASFRQFKKSYESVQGISKEGRIGISSSQQKSIIDHIQPASFRSIYRRLFSILQRSKILDKYVYYADSYLIILDGSGYYSSNKVKCNGCLKIHKDGNINYQHHVLQFFLVHPKQKAIIPLMPEEISNQDGNSKQDCETNAAKRGLRLLRIDHPKLKIILVGDGLYSEQPMIKEVMGLGMHFIFVAKPGDHKIMFEDIEGIRAVNGLDCYVKNENGFDHHYEWVNGVALNGWKNTQIVNFFSYRCIDSKNGKTVYQNSWVTDFEISRSNISQLCIAGRNRWKCENQGFNSLKNQGYHIDHNYGHGNQYLAFNNYLLNLISFFLHQFCELKDKGFKKSYAQLGNKALIWQKVRNYAEIRVFESFEEIFELIAVGSFTYFGIPPPVK